MEDSNSCEMCGKSYDPYFARGNHLQFCSAECLTLHQMAEEAWQTLRGHCTAGRNGPSTSLVPETKAGKKPATSLKEKLKEKLKEAKAKIASN